MTDERYEPIDCGFHDQLEELATLKLPTEIKYRKEEGDTSITHDVIEDVYSQDGAEYVRLKGGDVIRLDQILRIHNKR